MKASGRDRQIKIERFTVSKNDLNEDVKTWGTLATPFAAKGYRSAKEGQNAAEIAAMRILRFEVLWTPQLADLNPKDRIEYPVGEGIYFNITEVTELGRNEGLEIFAVARSDEGSE